MALNVRKNVIRFRKAKRCCLGHVSVSGMVKLQSDRKSAVCRLDRMFLKVPERSLAKDFLPALAQAHFFYKKHEVLEFP